MIYHICELSLFWKNDYGMPNEYFEDKGIKLGVRKFFTQNREGLT